MPVVVARIVFLSIIKTFRLSALLFSAAPTLHCQHSNLGKTPPCLARFSSVGEAATQRCGSHLIPCSSYYRFSPCMPYLWTTTTLQCYQDTRLS
uniref:Putative secreted protein n=1 Tax=Ixodes ricinus TaxID=34613 RepID=A0A6B0UCK3_IXORI